MENIKTLTDKIDVECIDEDELIGIDRGLDECHAYVNMTKDEELKKAYLLLSRFFSGLRDKYEEENE